ncbi:unnamed protein product [Mytilus edulis]|uniref:DZIP3-like HEPN domain-containing protein n=1 Tax=Mytilus edulis TaxID=6550 RepID=A0A8S3SYF5_MYTED|nr:unnamed protein product [Mytilus edulis]
MEKEKENYYRFICVIYEVGGDVQRCRLKRSYISSNFQILSHFLNDRDVLHTLFHLFFPTHLCCWKGCCKTQRAKGFSTNQWDILYDADPSLCCKQNEKICICCVTAKNVSESDLDISLLSLILNNCCNLTPNEKIAVQSLRDMKNNYISHPTNMSLSNSDFQSLWCQVEHNIKHLDSTKTYLYQQQILLHRPMDVSLVQKYFNNCFDASAQLDSKMKNLHAFIAGGEKRVIEAINDNYSQVNRKQEHILKYLQKLQSTKEYKQSESNNVGDCIRTKRKRHDPAVWLDVSDGQIDDLRYKTPDTKPLDESKGMCLKYSKTS